MRIHIRLSEKHRECPPELIDFFQYRGGYDARFSGRLVIESDPAMIFCFEGLEFIPGEALLGCGAWNVDFTRIGPAKILLINGDPIAAVIERSTTRVGPLLQEIPIGIRHLGFFDCDWDHDLVALADWPSLRSLSLARSIGIEDLTPLAALTGLEMLDLSGLYELVSLTGLEGLTSLRGLNLRDCEAIRSLDHLSQCRRLGRLDVSGCSRVESLQPLRELHNLKYLDLVCCGQQILPNGSVKRLRDFTPLEFLRSLKRLQLSGQPEFLDLNLLSGLTELRYLFLSRSLGGGNPPSPTNLSGLSNLTQLTSLDLEGWENLADMGAVKGLVNLRSLTLKDCRSLEDLGPLEDHPELRAIGIRKCASLRDLGPLARIPKLHSLHHHGDEGRADLSGCVAIDDIKVLADLHWVTDLNLSGCVALSNLSALSQWERLNTLHLGDCHQISDLRPLGGLRNLAKLNLSGARRIRSLEPLRSLDRLAELTSDFHPVEVAEILIGAAWRRRDTSMIAAQAAHWIEELESCEQQADPGLESLTTALCNALALVEDFSLTCALEDLLQRHPEFSTAPWKAWFGGMLQESGFVRYAARLDPGSLCGMTSGAIGGACATLPHEKHPDWTQVWLKQLEQQRLPDAKLLLGVASEICLAYVRSGDLSAMGRWVERFTDPSDRGLLDPVHGALARWQMNRDDSDAALEHFERIHGSGIKDPILAEWAEKFRPSDPEGAVRMLLRIEDSAMRSKWALAFARDGGIVMDPANLNRLITAVGEDSVSLGALLRALHPSAAAVTLQELSQRLRSGPE